MDISNESRLELKAAVTRALQKLGDEFPLQARIEVARVGAEILPPVALVLCGGGSRGAMEVGFYRAIHDLGLPVDFIIGSSRVLVRSFSIALERKFAAELDRFGALVRVHSVQPRFPHEIDLLDFRYSGALIDAAYRQTIEYFTAPDAGAGSLVCPSTTIHAEGVALK